jgi:hypothetical protein
MSPTEARSVAGIVSEADAAALKKAGKGAIAAIKKQAAGDKAAAALAKKAGV